MDLVSDGSSTFDMEKEQKEIKLLIESLQKFKPSKLKTLKAQSPSTPKTPTVQTRGRLTKTKQAPESRTSATVLADEGDSTSSFDLVLECLERNCKQNLNLLNRLTTLESIVRTQQEKIEKLEAPPIVGDSAPPPEVDVAGTQSGSVPLPTVAPTKDMILDSVVARVEKIEENLNSHFLLCRGPVVTSKIASATINGKTNLQQLKASICKDIFLTNIRKIGVDDLDLDIYGKNRNLLRVKCSNIAVRDYVLQQARLHKPRGIYMVEFLSSEKLRIYNRLLYLRRQYPEIVKTVFIKRGNIFARVGLRGEVVRCLTLEDVNALDLNPGGSPILDRPPAEGPVAPELSTVFTAGDHDDSTSWLL